MAMPLSWIRKISSLIPEMTTIPLFGKAPSFPWHSFSEHLAKELHVDRLQIHPREQKWEERDTKQWLAIEVRPLGIVFWNMEEDDRAKLTSWMLHGSTKKVSFPSEILQEGFYRYLLLESLHALQSEKPFSHFTMHLNNDHRSETESTFFIKLEITFDGQSCWGELGIPASFQKRWVQYFEKLPTEYIPSEMSKELTLDVAIKTGAVTLHREEWEKLHVGDALILDQGSYNAHKGSGIALLTLGNTPLFNCKIKHNQIELIDYAVYYEENMTQSSELPNTQEEGSIAIKDVPLVVTIEIARLKMSLDKIMHLNPGNVLELPIHPDQSVALVVNGQKIGRGELVYLGETLSVRILELS